ncbi:UNVERIFIED_CONTAM: WXG100 family type VII secretion target [Acetivibrio alkalicellulosi]
MVISEIRTAHRNLVNEINELKKLKSKFTKKADQSKDWWKGEAGKTFRDEHNEIDKKIVKLIVMVESIESQIKRLESEVRRADIERQAKKKIK